MAADALTDYLDAAVEAARRGAAVLEDWRGRFQVNEKGRADLVTDADLAAQQAVRSTLQARFPTHAFLEEEGGGDKARPASDAPPTWIVDPLDGTTNYVHDLPLYCVSIGLWADGDLIVGVVLDPRHQELFSAARGRGAFLNGNRLKTSRTKQLADALLATGFPPDVRGQERTLDWWRYLSFRTRSLRRTGSTALNLAYLAAGRFDGYWAFDNHAWDVAGGVVLVREAGGVVTNVDGSAFDPFTPDGLASNGPLHPVLVETLRQHPSPETPQ
jgi:myo-inositol-1(or 4)-monophosphatase